MHPWTSETKGFREFDGASFGELIPTEWNFGKRPSKGTVREFAVSEISAQKIKNVKVVGCGTYDVLFYDGSDYRVYTKAVK